VWPSEAELGGEAPAPICTLVEAVLEKHKALMMQFCEEYHTKHGERQITHPPMRASVYVWQQDAGASRMHLHRKCGTHTHTAYDMMMALERGA